LHGVADHLEAGASRLWSAAKRAVNESAGPAAAVLSDTDEQSDRDSPRMLNVRFMVSLALKAKVVPPGH
jgi:hypothetical protein